jgi:molybdopterin molybdotransferase
MLGKLGKVVFSRIKMGPGAALAFGLIPKPVKDEGSLLPVFALAGPPAGCLINFETLVRPALLKMRGLKNVAHPIVRATAIDSAPDQKPMAFVKWTSLTGTEGEYRVELNPGIEGLASRATANSLTIIPEGASIAPGDEVEVLPLGWSGI